MRARVLQTTLWACLLPAFVADVAAGTGPPLSIDADFPAGNIVVERIQGDDAFIRQDLRDTSGWWFYWHFRVHHAGGRTVKFHFTNKSVLGPQGPGYSLDGGLTWQWLGSKRSNTDQSPPQDGFVFQFPAEAADVRFCFAIPYVESNLRQFLNRHAGSACLKSDVLCKTAKGRSAEVLYLGRLDGKADYRLAFTCRHHACESVASYVLEGLMESVLADNETGRWFRQHAAVMAIPFVDKDGVEAGDQGKNRKPHDHNRDYADDSIYPTVAAIKKLLPQWSGGRLDMAIDLHCPSIHDSLIQFIGGRNEDIWQRTLKLSQRLESCQAGSLRHDANRNLPFGSGWNQGTALKSASFSAWASGLPNVHLATSIEVPYSQVGRTPASPAAARLLGRDLAEAIKTYLGKRLAVLPLVPSAASHAADAPLVFDDPEPRRYEITARASQIDPRARPHPEIDFVFEKGGKPLDVENAAVDTRVTPQGKLVIWLMGYSRPSFDRINSYGLHAVRVHYANGWFGQFGKEPPPADDSFLGKIRLEAATGEDFSDAVSIPKADGMTERALVFVKWLAKENPQGRWGYFLADGQQALRWDRVIMAGSSHGSTTAARFAKHQRVDRVVMFCGPRDQYETWQALPSATPANRFFGFSHVLDGGWTGHHYCRSWELLGMHQFGPMVNVDKAAPPYGNTRRLITDASVKNDARRAHSSVVPGGAAVKDASGKFAHEDVWRYLFTHPVEEVGQPVPHDPACRIDLRSAHSVENRLARFNIVFVLADDLGYGDLGCYGQTRIRTPHIDRMAAEGLRFTQHYAGNAVCAPSRCVLMTGRHPGHAYVRNNRGYKPEGQEPLPAEAVTLPGLLKSGGYVTGGFGKWGLGGPGTSGDPLKQGIHRWFGYNCQSVAHNYYPTYLWDDDRKLGLSNPAFSAHDNFKPGEDPKDPRSYRRFQGSQYSADLIAEQARKFIRDNQDRPFFCYLPTTVPHLALQVPDDSLKEYVGQWDDPPYQGGKGYLPHVAPRAAYAAMITRMDREVGRIMDLVKELGLDEKTIFIFSSDNGPLNGVHQGLAGTDAAFFNSSGGLRNGKGTLYEGGIRVPGIVRWKGRFKPGTVSHRVTGFEDWLPTLLELADLKDKNPAGIDGISFAPTLRGEKQPERPFLYREFPGYGGQQCVRVGNWKAVRQNLLANRKRTAEGLEPTLELYDLAADPHEERDVAAAHPDIVANLTRIMKEQHAPSKEFPFAALDK